MAAETASEGSENTGHGKVAGGILGSAHRPAYSYLHIRRK